MVNHLTEEYDLKKSKEGIGQLYPILVAKDGEVIDGLHRQQVDKTWKRVTLEHIDTEEKKLIARLVSNCHRRQVSWQEKEQWINGLAAIYQEQGHGVGNDGLPNVIRNKIVEATGLDRATVNEYLSSNYKQEPKGGSTEPRVSASQRIEKQCGKAVVERYRNELLTDPTFRREVLDEMAKPQVFKAGDLYDSPCPTGVCDLPNVMLDDRPIPDIRAESHAEFEAKNPQCHCKTCTHYQGSCTVYY